jgi:hypothetical protein
MRSLTTLFLISLSVSAVFGAYNDENIILRNINALLSFTQRTDLGNHIVSLPKCADAVAITAGYFNDGVTSIVKGGASDLNRSISIIGEGFISINGVLKSCGGLLNETGETFNNFTSDISKSPLSYLAIRFLNVAFRIREITTAWKQLVDSLPINNSIEVGRNLANIANTIFNVHPRLETALGKFINPPVSTGKGGGIINCLGLLDKTYLTLNRTWGDYKQNSRLEDLFNDFLIVGLEIPSTLKTCAQAFKNEGKKKKDDTVLLSSAPVDGSFMPRLILKGKEKEEKKESQNENNNGQKIHLSSEEFNKKMRKMFPLPPL